jgi:CheY-like chemotaxis protein
MHYTSTKHIFYLDDDQDDLDLFESALQEVRPDFKLTKLLDSRVMIETLERVGVPDLIILDINMPVKNGIECLRELKDLQAYKHIPVVIYSTSNAPSLALKDRAYALFVQKGSSLEQLKQFATDVCNLVVSASPATGFTAFSSSNYCDR